MLNTRTSTYQSQVNFFASTLQNQKSPSKKSANAYTYGFNSQEKDDEVSGSGNSYTAEFWQYDSRLGRRWNIDPVDKPWMSSYHAFSNKPITNIDPNGANDDWVETVNDDGSKSVVWDTEVTSPETVKPGQKYMGKEGLGVENDKTIFYGADGNKYSGAFDMAPVTVEGQLSDHQRTMNNPLVKAMHQGSADFYRGAASLSAHVLDMTGTAVTVAGYGAAFVPGGQPIAASLVGIGKTMSLAGGGINTALNVVDGNYIQAGVTATTTLLGMGVKYRIDATKITQYEKFMLNTSVDLKLNLFEKTVNTGIEQKKE